MSLEVTKALEMARHGESMQFRTNCCFSLCVRKVTLYYDHFAIIHRSNSVTKWSPKCYEVVLEKS